MNPHGKIDEIYQRLPHLSNIPHHQFWDLILYYPDAFSDNDIQDLTPIRDHDSIGQWLWPQMTWRGARLWFSITHGQDGNPSYIATLELHQWAEWEARKIRSHVEVVGSMHFRFLEDAGDRRAWNAREKFGGEYDKFRHLMREQLASELHWDWQRAVDGWRTWNG